MQQSEGLDCGTSGLGMDPKRGAKKEVHAKRVSAHQTDRETCTSMSEDGTLFSFDSLCMTLL